MSYYTSSSLIEYYVPIILSWQYRQRLIFSLFLVERSLVDSDEGIIYPLSGERAGAARKKDRFSVNLADCSALPGGIRNVNYRQDGGIICLSLSMVRGGGVIKLTEGEISTNILKIIFNFIENLYTFY